SDRLGMLLSDRHGCYYVIGMNVIERSPCVGICTLVSSSLSILTRLLKPLWWLLRPLMPLFRFLGKWVLRPLLMYVLVALLLRMLLASLL
ncbi:MAG: hypothetical protein E7L31_10100, partial [Aeromonas sp.]|nr:hypothetical protein [Aeromonas sp.]